MNEKVKLKVEYVKLEELIPFELNARTHSKEQVGQIVNSIGEFDFVNPILVGIDNMIIAGHGRLRAANGKPTSSGLKTNSRFHDPSINISTNGFCSAILMKNSMKKSFWVQSPVRLRLGMADATKQMSGNFPDRRKVHCIQQ